MATIITHKKIGRVGNCISAELSRGVRKKVPDAKTRWDDDPYQFDEYEPDGSETINLFMEPLEFCVRQALCIMLSEGEYVTFTAFETIDGKRKRKMLRGMISEVREDGFVIHSSTGVFGRTRRKSQIVNHK